MSSHQVTRKCAVAPHAVIRAATLALKRLGYETASTSDTEAHYLFTAGSRLAATIQDFRHRLTLTADGAQVTFLFEAGFSGSGLVIASEKSALDARVDQVMSAVVHEAKPAELPRAARCPVCATEVAADVKTCPLCGFAL